MSNWTRHRERFRNCPICGGNYHVVEAVDEDRGKRGCGCEVRRVPTTEEVEEIDTATEPTAAREPATDGGREGGDE